MVDRVKREKQIWSSLLHTGIVKLHSSFLDKKRLYFLMDYISNNTLRNLLLTNCKILNNNSK